MPPVPPTPPPPKRTSAQIRADMDRQRQELGQSVDHLRERVTEITDWRSQIKKHRRSIVVGAVATGFVVGGLMALRRR
jgi:dienelactone hydrolase